METSTKIMVVDDEKKICQNVEKILSKDNYEVSHAVSAKEALEMMVKDSFSVLISDIVMPDMNGLEFLKLVKKQWPLIKVIMITAYASTDTALKSIRLGALDYLPKPFTPDELRSKVEQALTGELTEAHSTEKEIETMNIIDIDIPFDRDEVAKYAGEEYVNTLGPSDMPIVEVPSPETLENFCLVGKMVCDIYKKLGGTCKAGIRTKECPKIKAMEKKASRKEKEFDPKKLIGIDQPFDYEEVVSITGPEYVQNLQNDGVAFIPYEELKRNVARLMDKMPESVPVYHEVTQRPVHKDILIIDDEVAVNNNIRKILFKKGYHVDQAITKEQALQMIEEREYKLVLLDLKIPGVKGMELLRAIRDKRPDAAVIIITGYASIETAVETARLGAIEYLPKPFTPDEIRNTTERALRLAA